MLFLSQVTSFICSPRVRLYIDPGTGSMLFAILIGLLGVGRFVFKGLWVKLRFLFSGGKKTDLDKDTIPLIIFSDDKRYWSVFEPIVRELNSRDFDMVYMTASEDDPALKAEIPHMKAECIGPGNHAFAKLNFSKATMLLSTTPGLDVYQWKRSKDIKYYIHIPHSPAELTTYRMFGTDYYDAMMLSGQYQIDDARNLEKLRDLPSKELTLVGIPFLDEKVKHLEEITASKSGEETKHERTVLLAPSWGESGILKRYGADMIKLLLDTGYHVIIRPHPQSFKSEKDLMDKLMQEFPENDQLEWNRDNDNFDALYRSDIMISDFSGVIFEFALVFDKPVICADTEFDSSPYDAWWLDTPTWGQTAIPRIGKVLTKENFSEIKNMIDTCIEDKSFEESRHAVRDETWTHRGEGAKLAADYLVEKYKEIKAK